MWDRHPDSEGWGCWAGSALPVPHFPRKGLSVVTASLMLTALPSPQNLMTTLPGQDAPLPPPQPPYISGQQPVYQQVSLSPCHCGVPALTGEGAGGVGPDCYSADETGACTHSAVDSQEPPGLACPSGAGSRQGAHLRLKGGLPRQPR